MFNNSIPEEFVNRASPNFVNSDENIMPLKVISKKKWSHHKQELNKIKRDIQLINSEKTFI